MEERFRFPWHDMTSPLREAVQQLASDWDSSLHMQGETYWKVEPVTEPESFFRYLDSIFPYGGTLLIEGLEMSLTAKALYEEFPAGYVGKVACDTLLPVPDCYHVRFSEAFARRLCLLIKSQGSVSSFYHFKGYSPSEVLFSWHDAFGGALEISSTLNETAVRHFAAALGATAELTPLPSRPKDHLRAIHRAMNPPWWRRVLSPLASALKRRLG